MTTDNRTNEPTEEQIERALDAISRFNQWTDNPRGAMRAALVAAGVAPQDPERIMLHHPDGTPKSNDEIRSEAAAKALHETRNPWIGAYGDWGAAGYEIKQAFRESARAALEAAALAAQGAAPQAESEYEHLLKARALHQTNAGLPSSGVDEDALAEVIEAEIEKLRHETRLYPDIYKAEVARAVAEFLKGEER